LFKLLILKTGTILIDDKKIDLCTVEFHK